MTQHCLVFPGVRLIYICSTFSDIDWLLYPGVCHIGCQSMFLVLHFCFPNFFLGNLLLKPYSKLNFLFLCVVIEAPPQIIPRHPLPCKHDFMAQLWNKFHWKRQKWVNISLFKSKNVRTPGEYDVETYHPHHYQIHQGINLSEKMFLVNANFMTSLNYYLYVVHWCGDHCQKETFLNIFVRYTFMRLFFSDRWYHLYGEN